MAKRGKGRRQRHTGGFTLVELMVVVAIIGVLAVVAVMAVNPDDRSGSARGFAEQLGARIEIARQRAQATQRIQRMTINTGVTRQWQANATGLAEPTGWDFIYELRPHGNVEVFATDTQVFLNARDASVTEGDNVPLDIDVLPDGRVRTVGATEFYEPGFTLFVQDINGHRRVRVLVFGPTGTTSVLENW